MKLEDSEVGDSVIGCVTVEGVPPIGSVLFDRETVPEGFGKPEPVGKKPVGAAIELLLKGTGVLLASLILLFSSPAGAEEADRANPRTVAQRHGTIFIIAECIERIDGGDSFSQTESCKREKKGGIEGVEKERQWLQNEHDILAAIIVTPNRLSMGLHLGAPPEHKGKPFQQDLMGAYSFEEVQRSVLVLEALLLYYQ